MSTECGRETMCQACVAKGGCGQACQRLLLPAKPRNIVVVDDDYFPEDWQEPDFDDDLDGRRMLPDYKDSLEAAMVAYEEELSMINWGRKPRRPKPATWRRIAGVEFEQRVRQLAKSWNCSLKEAENRFFGWMLDRRGNVVDLKKPRHLFPRPSKRVPAHKLEQ